MGNTPGAGQLDEGLCEVRSLIKSAIRATSLRSIAGRLGPSISGGKMLRAQLILSVGPAAGAPQTVLYPTAAAVEMLHAASLLHDDVVDGGSKRRGKPAFWVSEGAKAAILMGDLLVSRAAGYVLETLPSIMPVLITTLQEMCDAEAEQEFLPFPDEGAWARCVSIARRKTGSLFALAACCAAGTDGRLSIALRRAGYAIGTAYQLADDLVDTCSDDALFGKSLGSDARMGKLTAATARGEAGEDPAPYIERLLCASGQELSSWPAVQDAWARYAHDVMAPVIERFAACASAAEGA